MSVNFYKTMTTIPPIKFNAGTGSKTEEWENITVNGTTIDKVRTREKSFSKITELNAGKNDGNGYLTPLYADVTITLRPASSYSDNTIINFSSNTGKGYVDMEMEKRISYSNIEIEATEMGMQKKDKSQVKYIRVNEEDTAVTKNGETVVSE